MAADIYNWQDLDHSTGQCYKKVQISLVEDGIKVLGKAHMLSNPSLIGFSNTVIETIPMFV